MENLDEILKTIAEIAQDEATVAKELKSLIATESSIARFNEAVKGNGVINLVLKKYSIIENLGGPI